MSPADPLPATAAPRVAPPRTAVVALGSIVMGDDGAGAAVLAELEAGWELPDRLDRLDLGTPGPYLAEYVRDYDQLVVVDALRSSGEPGGVRCFDETALAALHDLSHGRGIAIDQNAPPSSKFRSTNAGAVVPRFGSLLLRQTNAFLR